MQKPWRKFQIKNKYIRRVVARIAKLKRRYKVLLIALLLIVGIFFGFRYHSQVNRQQKIKVDQVTRRTIDRKILRSGVLEYKGVSQVFSSSDGQITKLFVHNGDQVKKDQALFKVTSSANKEEKALAWSDYLSAKNALEKAKQGNNQTQSSLESAKQSLLTAEQAVKDAEDHRSDYTDKEFDALKAAERAARLDQQLAESDTTTVDDKIKAAQADFQVAWLKYQSTQDLTIYSTMAGRVENLSVAEGDIVAHTDNVPVLLLVSNPKQVVSVSIGEMDAALLKASQSAQLSVDAFPNTSFPAFVSRVDTVGMRDDDGVTYTAWLELKELQPKLLSGMAADVEILVETKTDVLAVPNQALQYRSGKYYVTLGDASKQIQGEKEVKIGIRDESYTQIESGVEDKESILILPQ